MHNQRAIFLLLLSNAISGISQGIIMIAIPWYYTATLGYLSEFGVFYGILTLISTVWSIYAGTLIDRYDRRKILMIQSLVGCIILGIASYISQIQLISEWLIAGLVFTFTVLLYNIHYMNIYSFAQEITPSYQYSKVISYVEIQGQATTIVGGALAAILLEGTSQGVLTLFGFDFQLGFDIPKWNLSRLFALDALTYIVSILILSQLTYKSIVTKPIEVESAWHRVKMGWNFLKDKPALLIFGWLSSAVFICVLLISFFLMPTYVSLVLNKSSQVFASSELYFALGALLAGYSARYFLQSLHEVQRVLCLFILGLVVFIIFIFNTNLALFYFANILFGYSNAAIRFNRVSFFWKIIPNHIMGRASSVINISSYLLRSFWGFIFAIPFFRGREGILDIMIVLFAFIGLSGFIVFIYRNQIKDLEN
jgi:MFS transporter, DHA3 family, macrolide efflux protein